MQLTDLKRGYLITYKERLKEREILVNLMTNVRDRTELCVYPSEMLAPSKLMSTIRFLEVPEDAKYIKPYPKNMLPESLLQDPVHLWRAESGIELVHREPDVYEMIRVWRNWLLMTDEQKAESDKKSKEFFNVTNDENFRYLLSSSKSKRIYGYPKNGDIISVSVETENRGVVAYVSNVTDTSFDITYLDNGNQRIVGETDEFELKTGDCANAVSPCRTTVGRFLLNQMLLSEPFGDLIPYINGPIDPGDVGKLIAKEMLKRDKSRITVESIKKYADALYYIGHFTELCVPTYSRAALSTDPAVAKRKKELIEEHKDELDDPRVLAAIEDELIKMDKDYLKDDKVMRFYGPLGGKPFNICRKKMYLAVGGIEAFSKNAGEYEFLQRSLSEGWESSDMSTIGNEIRKGSFNRGHETQKGGAQTKYLTRVFQDLRVQPGSDCKTHRGILTDFNKYPFKDYNGQYIWYKDKWTLITPENVSDFKPGVYKLRSPMYCEMEGSICEKCAGETLAFLDNRQIAILAIEISSTFLTMSLKAMHGTKLTTYDLKDINKYIIS